MDNFNMKQWLQENKVGPYSKTLLKEGTQQRTLEKLDDIQLTLDGQKYDLVIKADYEYTVESDTDPRTHPDNPISSTVFDIDVTSIDPEILELYRLEGNDYVKVNDPAEIQKVEAALKTDGEAMKQIEDFIKDYDIDLADAGEEEDRYEPDEEDRYEPGMDETVGYATITKSADPDQKF